MLNIKQKSRPDNNTRLELNSCSACGKHYQRLVTKVCLFYIQHESSSCIFLMPVCAVCTAVLVSVVHILLKKIMLHTGVPSIFISHAARARATHIVMITTVPALTSRGGTPPIMLRTFSLLSSMLSFSSMLRFLSFFFICCRLLCRRRVYVVMSAPCRLPADAVLRRLRLSCRVQAGSLPVGSTSRASR
jgi:hypothetical protein